MQGTYRTDRRMRWLLCLAALILLTSSAVIGSPRRQAREILRSTGVKGGLVVHLGSGDGQLTAALRADERYVVEGLDADPGDVRHAREHLHSKGLYGPVTVRWWDGKNLPYADSLVNLLVVSTDVEVPEEEIMRALAPGGVCYEKKNGQWEKTVKPWPDAMDDWSHFLQDSGNNAVANDSMIGPPRRLRWKCGPRWSRSHEFNSSTAAMVSAGGRVFYVFDEGITSITDKPIPTEWTLVARDAFNGLLLWKKPLQKWNNDGWRNTALRAIPREVPRRLVASADRVFITLGYEGAPVSVIDAASGKVVRECKNTAGTREIRYTGGVLLCRVAGKGNKSVIRAVDPETEELLWKTAEQRMADNVFAARGGKVCYVGRDGKKSVLRCVRLQDGEEEWQMPVSGNVMNLVIEDRKVVVLERHGVRVFSLAEGSEVWSEKSKFQTNLTQRQDVFVMNGTVWYGDEYHQIVGRDLDSGKVTGRVKPDEVLSLGHHPRCYRSKATENYVITPFRGVEFISVTGAKHAQCDWTRGACRYGIMPANGLLYVPQHPCFCYPGVKLNGFNALAPAADGSQSDSGQRLWKGPAYREAGKLVSSDHGELFNWPTYRGEGNRHGAAQCRVGPTLSMQWQADIGGDLTPPVGCGELILVAARDRCTVYAIDRSNGEIAWHYTADGPIDSPPTIHGGLVLFGSAGGSVYCLRASDGTLAWRFRAAPSNRRIMAFNHLESPWRVHGSVLIEDGVAYFTAGRSTYLDGGIHLFGLDPRTGEVLYKTVLDTWSHTRKDAENKPFLPAYFMEGARSDILVSEGDYIYLGQYKFDKKLRRQKCPYLMPDDERDDAMRVAGKPYTLPDQNPNGNYEAHQRKWLERTQTDLLKRYRQEHGGWNLGRKKMGKHVLSVWGFLDDSWFNRSYWMYSDIWPGYYLAHRAAKTGNLLCVGPKRTYAVQAYPSRNLQSPLFEPGKQGYLLLADSNKTKAVLPEETEQTTKGWGYTRNRPPEWYKWVPVRIRAMVLAGDHLFIAGPPDTVPEDDPTAAFEGKLGAKLWTVSAPRGEKLAECELDSPPVLDGMIAGPDRLYISTRDGKVACVAAK